MTYYGRPRTAFLLILILVTLILIDISSYFLIGTVLLFAASLCRMQLTLDTEIFYRVTLFNFIIREVRISPKEMKEIQFKRVGWKKRGAAILREKGFPIHINNYNSQKVFDDLHNYAGRYSIPVTSTKEYDHLIEGKASNGN
ncbi:hypothetical protein BME96_03540 [Virgibacillus halodenitrificans]|uniref:Uncharacterized protein n=1 Tax=Virgibacillus halodenitrificans TaxID=1482 RepID=A0AAC9IX27_VIRHA|nr:hypothetical protein [Virgibacillus halodenitrificans]APC47297.1 hypothetical protein BME96_03540 [Virgibacillus halodenitrificans]MCJ0932423.1 hypothetical protein [Virgibacillus halodenitrificans]